MSQHLPQKVCDRRDKGHRPKWHRFSAKVLDEQHGISAGPPMCMILVRGAPMALAIEAGFHKQLDRGPRATEVTHDLVQT
eukprot:scaffold66894_cov15-Prasinocladus_malaysianus.AAC.1